MQEAKIGDNVKVHYTGKTSDGVIFDSSRDRDPLGFKIGSGMVIPGFDEAVIGLKIGEKISKLIPAQDAYGDRDEELVFEVNKNQIPENIIPEVGMQLQLQSNDGSISIVTISDIKDNSVKFDANHFLAGKDLTFEIELIEIV